MPRRVKRSLKPRRKIQRRRRTGRNQPKTVQALKALALPDRLKIRLPYYENIKWSGNTDAFYDWNINSIWDPNRSGTGHQPLGFDQWTTLFNRYRVMGCKVVFTATNLTDVPVRVGYIADNQATGSVYLGSLAKFEQPHMKSMVLGAKDGAASTKSFSCYFSPARIVGSPMYRYMADNQYQAQVQSNPSEIIVGHVVGQSLDGTTPLNVIWDVRMIYYVEFFDRYNLNLSNTGEDLRNPDITPNVDTEPKQ